MLKIVKHLVPLFEGNKKQGFIHIVVLTKNSYGKMIETIDKHDQFLNSEEVWPPWEEFAGLAYDRTHRKGHKDWWLILPINDSKDKIKVDTVAHEALHITRMIYQSRGVLFDPNNDEPYAYLVGWIAGKAWEAIPKSKRKG